MNASLEHGSARAAAGAVGVDFTASSRPVVPPASSWAAGFGAPDWTAALDDLAQAPDDALALEVHLPFCASRCLYCGCDTTVTYDDAEIDRYLDALEAEMDLAVARIGRGREAVQLHVGGGTPNHLSDRQLWRVVEMVRRRFRLLPETSLSIECDPRRCSASQMAALRALGFGHVRFGMADLLPEVQAAVGRLQSPALMHDVVAMARQARFESVQVDLLCGLPLQTTRGLERTLERLLRIGPDRIACLRYEHQPRRFWNQCAIDGEALPDAARRRALWHRAADTLSAAGYEWIGCDLFVLEDDELALARERGELRCNRLGFASLPADHLLAFGCGRISDVAETLAASDPSPATWQAQLARDQWPLAGGCRRSEEQRRRRDAVASLLCRLELPREAAVRALGPRVDRLEALAERGWIEAADGRFVVTRDGHYELGDLCRAFCDAPPAGATT